MKRFDRIVLAAAALLLFVLAPSLRAQTLPAASKPAASVEERRKALNAIFQDYWEDRLEHDPELASSIGDKRYNDRITDYSVKAVNDEAGAGAELSAAPVRYRPRRIEHTGADQPRAAAAPACR